METNRSEKSREAYLSWTQKALRHPLIIFSIIHSIVFLGLYSFLNHEMYADPGGLERWFAISILYQHQLPYHDFVSEYPPVTILLFILPGLFFKGPFSYSLAFAVEMTVVDIAILILLAKIAEILGQKTWEILGVYSVLIFSIGPLITMRHDLVPSMLLILALYAFFKGKDKISWAILGLGVMTKIFPVFIAPLLVIYYLNQRRLREVIKGLAVMLAVIAICALPWLIIDAQGFLFFFTYHAERGLQCESSYATVLLVGQLLGLTRVEGIFNFGSWNLDSAMAGRLARLSPFIMTGALLGVYLLFGLILRRRHTSQSHKPQLDRDAVSSIWRFTALAVLALLLSDKIFSPQYLIWIYPLISLITIRWRYLIWSMFVVIGGLTQYIFPYHYIEFELVETVPVIIAAVRNFLLLLALLIIALPSRIFRWKDKYPEPGLRTNNPD